MKIQKADMFAIKFYKFCHALSESFSEYVFVNTDFWGVLMSLEFFGLDDNCTCKINIYGEGIDELTYRMKESQYDYNCLLEVGCGYDEDWNDDTINQVVYDMYQNFVKKGYSNFAMVDKS